MTHGFENHTGESAIAVVNGFRTRITLSDGGKPSSSQDETYEVATLVVRPSIARPDFVQVSMLSTVHVPGITIGGYLSKREAIYLRNRLTAFIEQGLDEQEDV